MNSWQLRQAARIVHGGGVIAYPTEAVFGLGCDPFDPHAVYRLLALKQRPWEKGLILIAADLAQLEPFILPLSEKELATVNATWPGPVTWLLPARPETPQWLRGTHHSIAVRVSDHPVARALCRACGHALVSTSANPAGKPPARSPLKVRQAFGSQIDYIVAGPLGELAQPTPIRDLATKKFIRSA
jgi:L-threonylcarbamoyladenylate synthase